jgi:hypothetical protein
LFGEGSFDEDLLAEGLGEDLDEDLDIAQPFAALSNMSDPAAEVARAGEVGDNGAAD